jgi:hypothetical protein
VNEIRHLEIDGDGPTDLAAAIREAAPNVGRIEIGEGKDRVIVADAKPVRKCAGCTLCCTVAGINELAKPPLVPCRHLKGHGCGIYPNRPKSCSSFACGWLLGNWDERFRPDKVGAYVAFFMTEEMGFYAVVQIDSRRLHRKRLRQLIQRLGYLPEIRVVYDDARGIILRRGQRPVRFTTMPRALGDYETLVYVLEEPR